MTASITKPPKLRYNAGSNHMAAFTKCFLRPHPSQERHAQVPFTNSTDLPVIIADDIGGVEFYKAKDAQKLLIAADDRGNVTVHDYVRNIISYRTMLW